MIKRFQEQIGPMVAGLDFDKEVLKEYYTALSEDIKKQKTRIGGDWVIANVAFNRDIRDFIFYFYHRTYMIGINKVN